MKKKGKNKKEEVGNNLDDSEEDINKEIDEEAEKGIDIKNKENDKFLNEIKEDVERYEEKEKQKKDFELNTIAVDFLKKYKFDVICVVFLIIFFTTLSLGTISGMKQLPSPLYGGDYYYQMGCVNNIRYGGEILANCNLPTSTSAYMPVYSAIVAGFANLFNLETYKAMLYFFPIILIMSTLLVYTAVRLIFKKWYFALFGVLLYVSTSSPIIKYSPFATFVMTPFFFLAMYLFYCKQTYIRAVFFGLSLGLGSITHSTLLPGHYLLSTFFVALLIIEFDYKNIRLEKSKYIFDRIKKLFPYLLIFAIISLGITFLYWFDPIIIKHGETSPHYLDWNGPDGDMKDFGLQMKVFGKLIQNIFFKTKHIHGLIATLLFTFSFLLMFFIRTNNKDIIFLKNMVYGGLFLAFSYLITVPLLGRHFVPTYLYGIALSYFFVMFALSGLFIINNIISKKHKNANKIFVVVILIICCVLVFAYVEKRTKYLEEDFFYPTSLTELDESKTDFQTYVLKNSDVNDVFLTTKELGFVINALTGRKLVVSRRAQNDAFEDMDVREMDVAVILYGNSDEKRRELIEKYDIKYFYWDTYWINSEYRFDPNGQLQNVFDPLIAFNENPRNREYLDKYNVSYQVMEYFVDPSLQSEYHPKYDLVMVWPDNYRNFTQPWNEGLDSYLKEVWSYKVQGQKAAVLYEVIR